MTYKIIGADQKEYGPIDAEQIRQWISEGRLNSQTRACLEGTQEWKPLGSFPEFGFIATPGAEPGPATGAGTPIPIEQVLAGDYTLDIGHCVSRGWNFSKNNYVTIFVPFLLMIVISLVTGGILQIVLKTVGLGRLPFAQQIYLTTPFKLIVNALIQGPLTGGLFYIYLSAMRARATSIGDLFIGYKNAFADLFLGNLVIGLILSVCFLPYTIISAERMAPLMERVQQNPASMQPLEILSQFFSALASTAPALFLCMIPVTYLTVNWVFTVALIIDKQMGFWAAMRTSWKIVHKHWFQVFGLVVLAGLIDMSGVLLCCIGLVLTIPISLVIVMFAYEDIFGRKSA